MTPEPEPYMWEQVGLGGADVMVKFRTLSATRAAAVHLMTCHQHHFAVVGEGQSIVMSKMASQCLQTEFGPTAQPDEAHGYSPVYLEDASSTVTPDALRAAAYEVLDDHQMIGAKRDNKLHCLCGWTTPKVTADSVGVNGWSAHRYHAIQELFDAGVLRAGAGAGAETGTETGV